jgi:hypothetical protein
LAENQLASAKVFARLLTKAADAMSQAGQRFQDRLQSAQEHPEQLAADDRASKLQKDALRRLDQLLDALKTEKGIGQARSQQGGGGDGGGQRGNPDDIPDIAQLKVLRSLQQEINERTENFGKQHPNPARLSQGEKRELDSLSKEQRELSELLDEVTKPSDSDERDELKNGNPKPEIRNPKPEIRNPKSETRNHWSGGNAAGPSFQIPDFRFILAQGADAPRSGDQPEPPVRLKKKAKPAEDSDKNKMKKPDPSKKEMKPKEEEKEDEPAPAEPEQDPKEIIGRISKNMENSKERLAQKDPGDGTQQVQRDIVADLDKLINQSQRQQQQQQQQQQSQSSSSRRQRQQASQKRRAGQQNRQASNQKSGQQNQPNQNNNAQKPGAGGPGGQKNMTPNADMYKDIWGHLPETLRKEMDAYSRVEFMSKYNDLLQQYYKRISEKGRTRSSNE